jgi:hypothetical protein
MYYRARYYHPALGRFVSADTVVPEAGNPQALNRYGYVFNNPLRYVDPTGHFTEEEVQEYFGVKDWAEFRELYGDQMYALMNSEFTWGDVIAAGDGDATDMLITFGFALDPKTEAVIMQMRQNEDGTLSPRSSMSGMSGLRDTLEQYENVAVYHTDLRVNHGSFERMSGLGWGAPPALSGPGGRSGFHRGDSGGIHFYHNLDGKKLIADSGAFVFGIALTALGISADPSKVSVVIGAGATLFGGWQLYNDFWGKGNAYDGVYPVFFAQNHPAEYLRRVGTQLP